MKNELKVFENSEFGQLGIIQIDGKEMFPATACAKMLGYSNPHKAISDHCKTDGLTKREVIDSLGRVQNMNFINEGNLYRLIVKSKLPSAEKFEFWVFEEVLPQIRKTGGYIPISQEDDELTIMAKAMQIMQKTVAQKDELILLQQPKVEEYNRLMDSKGDIDFKVYVKTAKLKVGRNIFMSVLRDNKILMGDNEPYQQYINQKYFKVILTEKNGHSYIKTLVTKKGIDWLNKKTIEWELYDYSQE